MNYQKNKTKDKKMLKVGLKGAKETEVLIAMTSDYGYVYGYVLLAKKVIQPKSC